jgi:phospholipase A-2-activating protein
MMKDEKVASCSRDGTIRVWELIGEGENRKDYVCNTVLYWHSGFVNSLSSLFNEPEENELLISGGSDGLICIGYTINETSPIYVLKGHDKNVCALDVIPSLGLIVSGSWDHTARIWTLNKCIKVLVGHESAVWAVLGLDNGDVITGSADKTIKIWKDGLCHLTLVGHTDCVRSLEKLPDHRHFVSCGNDTNIILWNFEGDSLFILSGHDSFIYSLAVSCEGEIASSGEDSSVCIWKGISLSFFLIFAHSYLCE